MNTGTVPTARCLGSSISTNPAVFGRNRNNNRRSCAVTAAAAASSSSVCSANKEQSDYYTVLSLEHSPAIGADEIKRAYRRLALRCHPDVCPPSRRAESTELFLELRRAYETLSDPARRLRYDAELSSGGRGQARMANEGVFARDVWEAQLCVLRARSERRQRATTGGRRHGCMAHA